MIEDRHGCYRIGNLKFYSKLEAMEMHAKTGIHPHWDFNDAVFSCYDWTKEPTDNILELYKQRAHQLRDKYDYIVLMYSGGADSHTVLQSFIDNDIKLDEIATWINYKGSNDKYNYLNAEIYKLVIPYMAVLEEKYPWLKQRIIDLTDMELNYFSNRENIFGWIYDINSFLGPNIIAKGDIGLKIKEWADIIHSGKKFCILWGKDKPRVYQKDNKFYMQFIDFIADAANTKSSSGKQDYVDEFFYWTPDKPEILIKQGHLIKNYLKSSDDPSTLQFVSTSKSDLAYREHLGKKYWLSTHGVSRLIYPNWDINTWQVNKPGSTIFSPRDDWFYNGIANTDPIKINFMMGMDKIAKTVPDYWKNDPNDFSKGIKGCWSVPYFLEK